MGVSSALLGCINCITLTISLPFLIVGFMIKDSAKSPCDPIMYKPLLWLGFSLLVISIVGMLGGCCRITIFLWLYAIVLFILIVGLLASLVVSAIMAKGKAQEDEVFDGMTEYHLDSFSTWVRTKVVGSDNWDQISHCMITHDVCSKMKKFRNFLDLLAIHKSHATPIEAGCCKPPARCGFEYVTEEEWVVPEKGLSSDEHDCKSWNNERDKLCYNCETCKAGYLAMFIKGWKKIAIINAVVIAIIFIIFVIALCAIVC